MKKQVYVLALYLASIFGTFSLSSCGTEGQIIPPEVPAGVLGILEIKDLIEDTIDKIQIESRDWRELLEKLEQDITGAVNETIRTDVRNVLDNSILLAGAELKCSTNLIAQQSVFGLQGILAELDGNPIPKPALTICSCSLREIDLSESPSTRRKITFSGYGFTANFDDLTAMLWSSTAGTRRIDDSRLNLQGEYLFTLNLDKLDEELQWYDKVVLTYRGKEVHQTPIIRNLLPLITKTSQKHCGNLAAELAGAIPEDCILTGVEFTTVSRDPKKLVLWYRERQQDGSFSERKHRVFGNASLATDIEVHVPAHKPYAIVGFGLDIDKGDKTMGVKYREVDVFFNRLLGPTFHQRSNNESYDVECELFSNYQIVTGIGIRERDDDVKAIHLTVGHMN